MAGSVPTTRGGNVALARRSRTRGIDRSMSLASALSHARASPLPQAILYRDAGAP